ncbi:MAG: glutathione S-transferase family protein [Polyangiaceae bacterium]
MGRMIDGKWTTEWYTPDAQGRFVRGETVFRGRLARDGSTGFLPVAGRYHLYVSLACPWAHRTLIVRALLGLSRAIPISVVHPLMADDGWTFDDAPGTVRDDVNGARFLREVYAKARKDYTGRVTVPVLWDRQTHTIVNNESREIITMLATEWSEGAAEGIDLYPEALRGEIDETITSIYTPINNGVYRAGFATTQTAYEEAVTELFASLDKWDVELGSRRYLCGPTFTLADVCLFTTLFRFDPVYHGHFKCNLRRLVDYPNLWPYVRDIYQLPGVAQTCDLAHIKRHYYESHRNINPTGIVPKGPILDHDAPPGRDRLGG